MTSRLAGVKVLLVEDEAIVALLAEDILADHGATVVGPATTVEQGLHLVATEQIDVGFLDVNLNGQRSYPIAAELRERGVPFVFATGYGSPGMEGAVDVPVINKPYRAEQIAAALESVMLNRKLFDRSTSRRFSRPDG